MATAWERAFGTTGGAGSGTVGNTQFQQVSPLADPNLLALFKLAQGAVPTQLNSLQSMIQGGMNSPLLETILGPALQRLQQPQAQQRTQLTDAARAAGGLGGSPYSNAQVNLAETQGYQTNDLIAQVISQMLNPLVQGQLQEQRNAFMPAQAYTDLLQASRPQIVSGAFAQPSYTQLEGSNFLREPFSDPYAELGMVRPGTTVPGTTQPPPPPPPTPNEPNPWANTPLPGLSGGGGGGSQITYNPLTGYYESAPSANSLAGRDEFGFTPADWAVDPHYNS